MVIAAVVAEYNPFHKGHAYHALKTREAGATHVVALMSGNFTQRGSGAIIEKRLRAKAALSDGVDLVIELPLPFAMGPAQTFADGAVYLAESMGCVDMLAFGSEGGYISIIKAAADAIVAQDTAELLREEMACGVTFAKARQTAVSKLYGDEIGDMLASPNDILGVEYVRALNEIGSKIMPFAVRRAGADHDSALPSENIASASYIRGLMKSGDVNSAENYITPAMASIYKEAQDSGMAPFDESVLELAMLCALRKMSPNSIAMLPDISEGLENRIYAAVRGSTTLAELCDKIKTKRITAARIKRILTAGFLGLTASMSEKAPPYIRVLGFNERGREILAAMRKTARLPVSDQLAYLYKLGGEAARFASLESTSTDIYALALPNRLPCGYDYTAGSVRVI